ncbi:MAG TPA: phosphopantetheine-binding protein [Thermoanaerobaculia bacterium]|nr:phosphopantetheine-binding protein [Thermoanaerobaculia bacterium]
MEMSEEEILAVVSEIARRELGYEGQLSLDARLLEELELDSIRRLALAVAVENRFRIILDPEEEAAIETVADLVRSVAGKLEVREQEPS